VEGFRKKNFGRIMKETRKTNAKPNMSLPREKKKKVQINVNTKFLPRIHRYNFAHDGRCCFFFLLKLNFI
jgi:hypothetical protein